MKRPLIYFVIAAFFSALLYIPERTGTWDTYLKLGSGVVVLLLGVWALSAWKRNL